MHAFPHFHFSGEILKVKASDRIRREETMAKILIWDRYPDWEFLAEKLAFDGHTVVWAEGPHRIKELVTTGQFDLVLLNSRKGGRVRRDVLKEIKREDPYLPVLVVVDPIYPIRDYGLSLTDEWVTRDLPYEELKGKISELVERPSFAAIGQDLTSLAGARS
jgi:DNA-binding response OmpR family regulator